MVFVKSFHFGHPKLIRHLIVLNLRPNCGLYLRYPNNKQSFGSKDLGHFFLLSNKRAEGEIIVVILDITAELEQC